MDSKKGIIRWLEWGTERVRDKVCYQLREFFTLEKHVSNFCRKTLIDTQQYYMKYVYPIEHSHLKLTFNFQVKWPYRTPDQFETQQT